MFQKFGVNLSKLNNMSSINIDINSTSKDILSEIPRKANEVTNGYLGYGILFSVFGLLYFVLSDKTPYGDFGYSDDRAMAISLGVVGMLGLTLLQANFIYSFKAVALFIALFMIALIYIVSKENKE